MIKVPHGYNLLRHGPSTIVIRKSYEECLLKQGISNPDSLISSFRSKGNLHSGRGSVPSIPIEGSPGHRMVIRKYLRGGFLRFFNRDIYLGQNRPFKELSITVEAGLKGIPTPDILAAVSIKVSGPFYCGYLISKELKSSCDLPSYLTTIAQGRKETFLKEKRNVIKRVASLIRLMHEKGFYHGDLNMKNIIVDTVNPHNIYIIDWDKSRYKERLKQSERGANVLRFCRSMAKLSRSRLPLTEDDQLFFLEAYWDDKIRARRDFQRLRMSLSVRSIIWRISENRQH
jgi:tRNA A-37 threonylcarbamoyl transferase component Bud32